jgi:hypothetical protein
VLRRWQGSRLQQRAPLVPERCAGHAPEGGFSARVLDKQTWRERADPVGRFWAGSKRSGSDASVDHPPVRAEWGPGGAGTAALVN